MPLTDKGKQVLANMQKTYGKKKGEQVFYATENAGKLKGVHKMPEAEMKKGHPQLTGKKTPHK